MKKDRRDFIKMMTAGVITASLGPLAVSGRENTAKAGPEEVPQENRVEEALSNMQKYGSCCTGVLATYSPELGIEKDLAAGLGRGMAGGIGGLGHVCEAVGLSSIPTCIIIVKVSSWALASAILPFTIVQI